METTIDVNSRIAVDGAAQGRLLSGPMRAYRNVEAMGALTARTIRAVEDSGIIIQALTDNTVVTLPTAALCKGQEVTVQNVGAATAAKVSISPASTDAVVGTVAAVSSSGALNKDWINTKGTSKKGDYTTLISDGVTSWIIVGGVGVWASEA